MPNAAPDSIGAIAQCQPTDKHNPNFCKQVLKAQCQEYLKYRSELESIDLETDRIVNGLGKVTANVANLLGPLESPLVMEVDGVLVVINVANGLLIPNQLTASLTVASTAEDLFGPELVL